MTLVGRHIGRYRILEELGSGGMSVVYKGLDTALDREVAVKVLHPHLAGKDESRRRLAREARAVAKLHHPNILEVFDFSSAEAHDAFIVTEYIRGRTLKTYLDEGPLEPPELAAMIIHELAAALAHAHEAGVIHRDLKPENVMVREDGVLKLMDFGIARLLDIEDRMTVTGALVGSPAHMSPEIIEGLEAGPEADVFSLGIMFYALMTGRLPFTASNTTATLKRILDGAYEDPRRRVPTLSDELAEICATCLQRDPARRYPNAGKLRDALADALAGLGFSRVGEELISFFADPPSYQRLARQRIVAALLERGERQLAEKRTPRALACLNHVLALDATNERALGLLKGIQRQQRRRTWRRRGIRVGIGAGVALALGLGGWQVYRMNASTPETPKVQPVAPRADGPKAPDAQVAAGATGTQGTGAVTGTQGTGSPDGTGTFHGGQGTGGATGSPDGTGTPQGTQATGSRPTGAQGTGGTGTPGRDALLPPDSNPRAPSPPERTPSRPAVVASLDPQDDSKSSRAGKIPVSILVRPYGSIRVDGGPAGTQQLAQHDVHLTPGEHTVTVSCGYCEDATETIDVKPDRENVFRLRALLKASQLAMDYQPPDATVRVGDVERTASESLQHPFDIRSPRGPASFQHRVEVEISSPGYKTEKRVVLLEPGKPTTLRGSLAPE
ncbi:serine/threonine protein kinase [Corallococcus coralloides DSM 2259]|uniref:Serine/threonine protein kinase n=1 Tax=Corallococcus coralloides (strain ATCC 25202 / DSM 2259 / NBRC 100086 / M2) TaxID=1144275 RepID=H8MU12_CORCM|nr:serine/threonine-protein kinase [Corallococcus coralloides]AFE09985.1 serine/threonine protein kinase [Corallococcus coralloides DSM 2259]